MSVINSKRNGGFSAPEVRRGGVAGKAADLWSMGCILYWMLCGVNPLLFPELWHFEVDWTFISSNTRNMMFNLLSHDPARRPALDDILGFLFEVDVQSEQWRYRTNQRGKPISRRQRRSPVIAPNGRTFYPPSFNPA